MTRKLFAFVSLLSLLLCLGDLWLFARRGRVIGDRHELFSVYIKSRSARYTLRGEADRLALCAPPPITPTPNYSIPYEVDADPRPLLAMMRNEDMEWEVLHYEEQEAGDSSVTVEPRTRSDTAAILRNNRLKSDDPGLLIPGLLEAMEDPQRAVNAHYNLCGNAPSMAHFFKLPQRPLGRFTIVMDGMKVDCAPLGEPGIGATPGGLMDVYWPSSWHVDPAQFPSLCAQWHARLDRPVLVIPYVRIAAATATIPGSWLALWLRRTRSQQRRRRENLCLACGYDLRASKDRCPECGTPVGKEDGTAQKWKRGHH